MCDIPIKCGERSCQYYAIDRHLEYYNYPYCKKNGKEIHFSLEDGWDRMNWCPLLTEEQKQKELYCEIKTAIEKIHPFMIYSDERKKNESTYHYLVSTMESLLKRTLEMLGSAVNKNE